MFIKYVFNLLWIKLPISRETTQTAGKKGDASQLFTDFHPSNAWSAAACRLQPQPGPKNGAETRPWHGAKDPGSIAPPREHCTLDVRELYVLEWILSQHHAGFPHRPWRCHKHGHCLLPPPQASLAIPRLSSPLLSPNSAAKKIRFWGMFVGLCLGKRLVHCCRQRANTCKQTALRAHPLHHASCGQHQVPIYSLGRIPSHCFQIKTNVQQFN